MVGSTEVMRGNNPDELLTLGELVKKLGTGEGIIAEFPNGKHRYLSSHSRLDESDAALPIVKPYKYDWLSKTFHVKVEKKEDDKLTIKPAVDSYIDPISQMKNIKEWYGILYDKYLKIKKVIHSGPATIIFWNDGTKTVVKAQDEIDYEKGILYAVIKKLATKKEYDDILRTIDKVDEACKNEPVVEEKSKTKKREYKYQKCPVCGKGYNLNYYRTSKLSKQGFVDIRCSKCDTLFRVKGDWRLPKWHTKLEHDVLIKGGDK